MPLPDLFLARLAAIVPEDRLAGVLATFEAPSETAFRLCTLRAEASEIAARLQEEGVEFELVEGVPGAYRAPDRAALLASEAYAEGLIYVQNLSSQLPPLVLAPQPGERVLDLCAAPGSKTGQMAALMQDEGEIVAVEKVRGRYYKLRANVEAQGATCVRAVHADGAAFVRHEPESFDRVLLDAPCTTEGRFLAGVPETTRYWSRRKIQEMRKKQRRLLVAAVYALRPGGSLVYSTCTFAPEENEGVVTKALRRFGDAIEVVAPDLPEAGPVAQAAVPGLGAWNGRPFRDEVEATRRLLPDGLLEAFYVARIVKHESTV